MFRFLLLLVAWLLCVVPSASAQAGHDWTLTLQSAGPVRFGMTPAVASRVLGVRLVDEEDGDCAYGYGSTRLPGLEFGTSGYPVETISHVIVRDDARRYVRTRSGIGIGSSVQDVRQAYPGQIRERAHPHPFVHEGERVLEFQPRDRSDRAYALLFEVRAGRVTGLLVGEREAVMREPCGSM